MYSGIVHRKFPGSTVHFLPYLTKAFWLCNNNNKNPHFKSPRENICFNYKAVDQFNPVEAPYLANIKLKNTSVINMASFKNLLLKAFKNFCSLFHVKITEILTFFLKQLEYQNSYLAWECFFHLLSGMQQNVLELLFREPDVDQHSIAQFLRFCHKPITPLEDLRNSLYLGLSVYKIARAFLIVFSPHALASLF